MTIKQLGGVFGRNPTFNDVTIEGQLTFDGDIDINSDLKVDGNLEVTGTSTLNGNLEIAKDNPKITLNDTDGGTQTDFSISANANVFSIYNETAAVNTLRIFGNTQDVRVETGNLVIATSGKGIDFSATAGTGTYELLDDYEEGTWTPVPFGATSAGTYSTTFVAGNYVLVGKIITINCTVAVTSFTGTGDFRISGLPYPAAASQGSLLTVQYNNSPFATLTSTNQLVVGQLNSSEIRFRASSSVAGGAFETPQCSASTVSYLRVSGSYEVA